MVIESYSLKKKLYGDEYVDEIKEKLAKELSTLKFIMYKLERDRKFDKSKKQKKLEKLTKEKNELEKELEKLYDA